MCRQWLPRNMLEPLGVDTDMDRKKLKEGLKPSDITAVRKAYKEMNVWLKTQSKTH